MRKNEIKKFLLLLIILATMPQLVSAAVEINEIMYDLPSPGSDDKREWIEVQNTGSVNVDITNWKFDDSATSKHGLNIPPANGSQGSMILPPNSFAILADNATTFLSEHPSFSGTLIDTTMDLGQQKDKTYDLQLIDAEGNGVGSVSYTITIGANGDGNSLQKISGQWKVGTPTPGAANVANSSSGNNPQVNEQSATSSSQNSNTSQTSSTGSAEKPPEMLVKIIANKTAVVGADALLSGKALGADGKPLDNVRFLWNFGDGETKEGQNVLHRFRFPGEYIVMLDIAYGKWSATARLTITAIKSPLIISQIKEGTDGFVEIINEGNAELDLFGWYLKSGNVSFLIPKNTIIGAGKKIIFPNEVTKLNVIGILLLYPNGVVAASYEEPAPAPPPASFPESDSGKPQDVPIKIQVKPVKEEAKEEVAAVYEATKVAGATPRESGLGIWLLALGGLIVVSLGAFLFSKQKPTPADEYKIIE